MRVTEKGQVTIPKPIRDKLGIGPGAKSSSWIGAITSNWCAGNCRAIQASA